MRLAKTIFIDKPLLRKRMTPRDCNQKFYDIAFKSMCLDYNGRLDVNDTKILSGKTSGNEKDSVEGINLERLLLTFGPILIMCWPH